MYVWGFFNAWTPSNSLNSTTFLDHSFKAVYFILFKESVNSCLPYK